MRFPHHLLRASTFRSEPLMAAMAVVAVGMFVGAWVIGPAITHGSAEVPPVAAQTLSSQDKPTFDAMRALPDPPPYRVATPAFDVSGPPHYAAAAKQKAQAEMGGQVADDEETAPAPEAPRYPRGWSSRYYRPFDRHKVY